MFELLKRGSEYSIKLLLEVNHELTSFEWRSKTLKSATRRGT